MVKRFEVYMCPVSGVEKPCLVISPDEMNDLFPYVLVAPITTSKHTLPTRLPIGLKGKKSYIALDLVQPVDADLLTNKVGALPDQIHTQILSILQKMFIL